MANMEMLALQMNAALQKFVKGANLSDSEAMEVADLYESWDAKLKSKLNASVGEILKYGVNADGETQLYQVLQEHTPQEHWAPNVSTSLYKKVGFTDGDIPIWTQPLGASDAYQTDDVVSFDSGIWKSIVDNNVWQPNVYGWAKE